MPSPPHPDSLPVLDNRIRFLYHPGGAFSQDQCFSEAHDSDMIKAYRTLHELEPVNLVLAVQNLRPYVSLGYMDVVNTNNTASVQAFESGWTTDITMSTYAGELWLNMALAP